MKEANALWNLSEHGFEFLDAPNEGKGIKEIGYDFGGILEVPTMPLVQTLTPRSREREPTNTYSGNYGYGEFPFHSDMAHWIRPPRYVVLRCAVPDPEVATKIIRTSSILPDADDDLARRAMFRPRRRLDFKSFLLKVSEPAFQRWDSLFIEPCNEAAITVKTAVESKLATSPHEEIRFTHAGQMLIFDNWRVLHGRSAILNPSSNRTLERIYLASEKL